jgi:archaellum biogenesis protein FlaJ (TadC family)
MKMEKHLNICLNFFQFFGVSVKICFKQNSCRDKLLSIWSIAVLISYSVLIIVPVFTAEIIGNKSVMKIFVIFGFLFFCLSSQITLASIWRSQSKEEEFWKIAEELEKIFSLVRGKEIAYKKAKRKNVTKIVISIFVTVLIPLSPSIIATANGSQKQNFILVSFHYFCIV